MTAPYDPKAEAVRTYDSVRWIKWHGDNYPDCGECDDACQHLEAALQRAYAAGVEAALRECEEEREYDHKYGPPEWSNAYRTGIGECIASIRALLAPTTRGGGT